MEGNLLASAREQAERSAAAVRAAALMRIARVETRTAPTKARRTFERGVETARQLDLQDRDMILMHARWPAAAVDPGLLAQLPRPPIAAMNHSLYKVMMQHGHVDAAVGLVMEERPAMDFPFFAVPLLMHHARDEATRRELFRHAIAAWRAFPQCADLFLNMFQSQWRVLPEDEAVQVTREIVNSLPQVPDEFRSGGTYDPEGTLSLEGRENRLFQMLGPLRQLDPLLTDSLLAEYPRLAFAARRYPNGLESVNEERQQRHAARSGGKRGYFMAGNGRDFPFMESLIQADEDSDFAPPLRHAIERYEEDTSRKPNGAPLDCWASTQAYRSILYRAGTKLGAGAARLLDEIPHPDIRLLAQIELAAALAGLPELAAGTVFRPVREVEPATPTRTGDSSGDDSGPPRIRCPKCNWSPRAEDRWQCNCRHIWNTFDTGGVCPGCMHQWKVTQCLRCGQMSPHSDWYTHAG
jgi:hypothetical protein